jgi:hypothetical protein
MKWYYDSIFNYKLTSDELFRAKDFARRVAPTTFKKAKERDSSLTPERHLQNHVEGAMTEIAAKHFLVSKGFTCSEPDFNIHSKKSFDADLRAEHSNLPDTQFDVHVKSQTVGLMEWCKTPSYSFQMTDRLITRPKYQDLMVLTIIKADGTVDIISLEDCQTIFPRFAKPTIKNHRDKKAIYWKDIVDAREHGIIN